MKTLGLILTTGVLARSSRCQVRCDTSRGVRWPGPLEGCGWQRQDVGVLRRRRVAMFRPELTLVG